MKKQRAAETKNGETDETGEKKEAAQVRSEFDTSLKGILSAEQLQKNITKRKSSRTIRGKACRANPCRRTPQQTAPHKRTAARKSVPARHRLIMPARKKETACTAARTKKILLENPR
ncbi:MAG: hypothetical protein L6V35_00275 [Alistipes putredinis]|nr:MAG: hypothetical protein L6V35_00275 [Alistipes putredinis]